MSEWHRQETYKGMITLSIEVLRALILINGGAAVAILAFMGSKGAPTHSSLGCPLLIFATGVASAVLAALVAYITQNTLYLEETEIAEGKSVKRTHQYLLRFGLALAFGSVVAFMIGCTLAANALSS